MRIQVGRLLVYVARRHGPVIGIEWRLKPRGEFDRPVRFVRVYWQ